MTQICGKLLKNFLKTLTMSNPNDTAPEEQIEFNEEEMFNDDQVFNEEEALFNEEEAEFNFIEEEESNKPSFEVSDSIEYPKSNPFIDRLIRDIKLCETFLIDFTFDDSKLPTISFKIPTTILPLSVRFANGFIYNPYLVEVKFEANSDSPYKAFPQNYEIHNPYYGSTFPGSILFKIRFSNFFKANYKPPTSYRCQNYVLPARMSISADDLESSIRELVQEGFSEKQAKRALLFCSNDVNKARDYLILGVVEQEKKEIPVCYADCPLLYLILELCESFTDMNDCCCACGEKLGVFCLKPSCCDKEICKYKFMDLGVGTNIIGEIKRDPYATDFLIALAGGAYIAPTTPPVFDPSPESQGIKFDDNFFIDLPSMQDICNKCDTDSDLKKLIGENYFDILRFFILANKAQLITLRKPNKVDIKTRAMQFLVTSVSPESELVFRSKMKKFGVKWFWHGSHADRWYRILHTGLKDMGRTDYELHGGPWFGDGIYMSDSFNVSLSYCSSVDNIYQNSVLPKKLMVISLVENANVPELSGPVAANEYTQRDESACITRVLFLIDTETEGTIGYYNDFNTLHNKIKVPELRDVLANQLKPYMKYLK